MTIRPLDPLGDFDRVAALYQEASDYWHLADRRAPDAQKARDFFTDGPPGCDPNRSARLGIFVDGRLSGVAELSFGFPRPEDAYLGLLLLAPRVRGLGLGRLLLSAVESRARVAGSPRLYLGVLEANRRGRAFWQREGFVPTGVSRQDDATGHLLHRLVKPLANQATSAR